MFLVGIGAVTWCLQAMALMFPMWRQSFIGVMGYPQSRSWGIFAVKGRTIQSYHSQSYNTCGYYAELNVGGLCASPICLWYRQKCEIYTDFMAYSYTIGALM